MKDSTKDKLEGKFHEVKGKSKEVVGHAMGNPKVAIEGTVEKFAGKAQEKLGQIKKHRGR
jgi:uncharacterized protein YjbJ (UPF0337 family)